MQHRRAWLSVVLVMCAVCASGAMFIAPISHAQQTNQNTAPVKPRSAAPTKRITPLRTQDSTTGSRVTITSDVPLNDYAAYKSGNRFVVVVPNADVSAVKSGLRGRGFENAEVVRRGNDAVISLKLKPGANARASQRFNSLDIQVDAPDETPSTATAASGANTVNQTPTSASASPAPTPSAPRRNQTPNTLAGVNPVSSTVARQNPITLENQAASPNAAPASTSTNNSDINSNANPDAVSGDAAAASDANQDANQSLTQIAQLQPPVARPSAVSAPVASTASGNSLLATTVRANLPFVLLAALLAIGGLVFAMRAARRSPSDAETTSRQLETELYHAKLNEARAAGSHDEGIVSAPRPLGKQPHEAAAELDAPYQTEDVTATHLTAAPVVSSQTATDALTYAPSDTNSETSFDTEGTVAALPLIATSTQVDEAQTDKTFFAKRGKKKDKSLTRAERRKLARQQLAESTALDTADSTTTETAHTGAAEINASETSVPSTTTRDLEPAALAPVTPEPVTFNTAAVEAAQPVAQLDELASLDAPATATEAVAFDASGNEKIVAPVIEVATPAASDDIAVAVAEPEVDVDRDASPPVVHPPVDAETAARELAKLLNGESFDELKLRGANGIGARELLTAELLAALASRHEARRTRARDAFVEYGFFAEAADRVVRGATTAERISAIRALALSGNPEATSHLIAAAEDDKTDVRRAVVEALGSLRDSSALETLFRLRQSERSKPVSRAVPLRLIEHAIENCTPSGETAARDKETLTSAIVRAHETARSNTVTKIAPTLAEIDARNLLHVKSRQAEQQEIVDAALKSAQSPVSDMDDEETDESQVVVPDLPFKRGSITSLTNDIGSLQFTAPDDALSADKSRPVTATTLETAPSVPIDFLLVNTPSASPDDATPIENNNPTASQSAERGTAGWFDVTHFAGAQNDLLNSALDRRDASAVEAQTPDITESNSHVAHDKADAVTTPDATAFDISFVGTPSPHTPRSEEHQVSNLMPVASPDESSDIVTEFDLTAAASEVASPPATHNPTPDALAVAVDDASPSYSSSPESASSVPGDASGLHSTVDNQVVENQVDDKHLDLPGFDETATASPGSVSPIAEDMIDAGGIELSPTNHVAANGLAYVTPEPQTLEQTRSIEEADGIPAALRRSLASPSTSERVTAVAALANYYNDETVQAIHHAFDDRDSEVRNAAAQSLHRASTNHSEAFTRALREATPARRRNIGAAIAGSGLADHALKNLTGESRERTYDAFSLLFLMAKAGEFAPLMRAIEFEPDIEIRLAVVKLLALSGQPEVLPAFRRLAVRGTLPPEVRAAVMEAVYQISNPTTAANSKHA